MHPSSTAKPELSPAPPGPIASAPVLGVPLALTDYLHVLDWIDAAVAARSKAYVCVAATHTVVACSEDADLRAAVLGADFTVPDGQPLVWALRLLGHPLRDRVYGPTLMEAACERAARSGQRFYLYGGRNRGALVELTENLRRRFPGLQIVGGHVPPFRPQTPAEEDAVATDIARCRADVVWVGIGVPKQEKWMSRMRERLDAPVLVGVGAAFDFHAGLIPQAPGWLQRAGLEWVFRLLQEPGRLWRRYLRYNPRFVVGVVRQYVRHRRTRGR